MRRGLWIAALLLLGGRLEAQASAPFSLWGSVSMLFARQAVADQDELTGSWLGAGLQGTWRGASLEVRGSTGTAGSGSEERHMRLTDARLRVQVLPWLSLGAEGDALRSAEPGDTAVWRMAGPMARVSGGLGVDGLRADGEAAYFPITGVSGLDPLARALRLEVGMTYYPGPLPVGLRLAFRRQTFDFSDGRPTESLGGVTLAVRARLLGH